MAHGPEVERLVENLDRLREKVEAVRGLSPTARDDVATVLHALVGGDGRDDGYGLVNRAFDGLGLGLPKVPSWDTDVPDEIDGKPVLLALRGSQAADGPVAPLPDHLQGTCLRFAVPGIEPDAKWSYLDLIKKVRNKFGSHVDKKPPHWLQDLRFYPAGDSDAVTFLLWRAAEITLASVADVLADAGIAAERYAPGDRYLDGIDLSEAYVLGHPDVHLDVRAELGCTTWASGNRRAIVGGMFGDTPFVFGLMGDARLSIALGPKGASVGEATLMFRLEGFPKVGRNDPGPCLSGRKFKLCHGRFGRPLTSKATSPRPG